MIGFTRAQKIALWFCGIAWICCACTLVWLIISLGAQNDQLRYLLDKKTNYIYPEDLVPVAGQSVDIVLPDGITINDGEVEIEIDQIEGLREYLESLEIGEGI